MACKKGIPPVGLGVYKMGDSVYGAVRCALELGYRHIDTAQFYENEEEVGRAIRDSGIPRQDIFVTTKLWPTDFPEAEEAFLGSLKRLGLEYLDCYMLHWPGPDAALRHSAWNCLLALRDKGVVLLPGVSNFGPGELDELIARGGVVPGCNQLELHPWLQQRETVSHCRRLGIPVVAWAPLCRGAFLEEPLFAELARAYGRTPAQILLRWHIQRDFIPIPKSATPARIRENFGVFDFSLSGDDMRRVDALDGSGQKIGDNPFAGES